MTPLLKMETKHMGSLRFKVGMKMFMHIYVLCAYCALCNIFYVKKNTEDSIIINLGCLGSNFLWDIQYQTKVWKHFPFPGMRKYVQTFDRYCKSRKFELEKWIKVLTEHTCPSSHCSVSSGSCPSSSADSPDCQMHCQMDSALNGGERIICFLLVVKEDVCTQWNVTELS